MMPLFAWIAQYGYAGLFAMLMLGIAGLPIPDETLLVISGVLISRGKLNAAFTLATAICGSICGISLSYLAGRTLGRSVIERYGRFLHITPDRIEQVHRWFRRMGEWLLLFGYFIPGIRHFTALVAGMSRLEYPVFAAFAYSGAFIWASSFLAIGYVVGDRWEAVLHLVHSYVAVAAGIAVLTVVTAWLIRRRLRRT